ncbi:MAG TPA: xanthine dehydrogenase family protein molybdopterin-binding subunit [Chloroflexota bacterium]|nr:xanthine dehydrogenase family protein molybdopterin-binding subunit [Chloroflexota bacterium]
MSFSSPLGKPVRRREDAALVTGRGRFVDDLTVPGTVYLALARSPYAKARILNIDTSAALASPDVLQVVTGADLSAVADMPLNVRARGMHVPPNPVLARDTVNAVGIAVAAVVAESRAAAEDAAAAIEVDYQPLDAVADAAAALDEHAPRAWDDLPTNRSFLNHRAGGDADAAFAAADHIVALSIDNHRLAPVAIEPRAVLAVPDPLGDGLTLYVAAQSPFRLRAPLARLLGLAENRVRVVTPDVGGAFGAKNNLYREYVVAGWCALRLQRPVKWVATRSEEFVSMQQGRDMRIDVELAVQQDGTFTGLRVRNVANLGAYLQAAAVGPSARPMSQSPGCYVIANVEVDIAAALTNTTAIGPYRGAGRPESVLLIERIVDEAARALGTDPVALRRRNFLQRAAFPHTNALGAVYDSGDYAAALDKALALSDYPALLAARETARAAGRLVGVGWSTFVEPSAGAGFESGLIRIEQSGRVTAITGSSAQGQGHETTFAQLVADRLGVSMDQVVVMHGDTHGVPQAIGTFGSRSATMGGSALSMAADRVLDKARRMAAHLLEASPDDVLLLDGAFGVAGAPDRQVTWADLGTAAYGSLDLPPGDEAGLEATAFFTPEGEVWGFGAHVALLEIDRDTGVLSIQKLVCVDDCGTVLNPLLVEGQVLGGLGQGLGQALMEQVVYTPDGQLQTGSLGDYAVPRAADLPTLDQLILGHTVTPSPFNPLGVKGVGEAGTVGAPAAIANAVVDALASFGVRHVDMPFTAEKLWKLIHVSPAAPP